MQNSSADATELDTKKILEKLKQQRTQLGKEHLKIANQNRGEILSKLKFDLLQYYAMQANGLFTLDNKEIN